LPSVVVRQGSWASEAKWGYNSPQAYTLAKLYPHFQAKPSNHAAHAPPRRACRSAARASRTWTSVLQGSPGRGLSEMRWPLGLDMGRWACNAAMAISR